LSKNWMNVLLVVLREIMKVLSFGNTCVQARSPNYDVQEPQKNRTAGNNYGREGSKIHGQGRDKSRCVPCRHHGDRRIGEVWQSWSWSRQPWLWSLWPRTASTIVDRMSPSLEWAPPPQPPCGSPERGPVASGVVRKVYAVMTPRGRRNEERDYDNTDPISCEDALIWFIER
jgi:hypothetical protein